MSTTPNVALYICRYYHYYDQFFQQKNKQKMSQQQHRKKHHSFEPEGERHSARIAESGYYKEFNHKMEEAEKQHAHRSAQYYARAKTSHAADHSAHAQQKQHHAGAAAAGSSGSHKASSSSHKKQQHHD